MSLVFVFGMTNTYADTKKENKKEKKTIVIKADIHCKSCKAKLEKNIPFEKGVRDLKVDMKAKTITVTYRADKTNREKLVKAIEKCGIKVIDEKGCSGKCGANCCKVTGDKSKCCKHGHHHDGDKCDKKHSKEHKCTGECKTCKDKTCKKAGTNAKCDGKCDKKCSKDKDHKCKGECKTCKDKKCSKSGTDAKCDKKDSKKEKKHTCSGCSGCSH